MKQKSSFDKSLLEYYKPKIEDYLNSIGIKRPSKSQIEYQFKEIIKTLTALDNLTTEAKKLEEQYKKAQQALYEKEKKIKSNCKHVWIWYCSDPSGNNDSSYECRICRSESKDVHEAAKHRKTEF